MHATLYRPHGKEYCIAYQSRHGTLRGIHNDWCEVPVESSCSWENQQHGRGHHVKVIISNLKVGAVVKLRLMHEDETAAPAFKTTRAGGLSSTMLVGLDPRDWREGLTWTSKDQEGPRKWQPASSFVIRVVSADVEARCVLGEKKGELCYLLPCDRPAVVPVRLEVLSAVKGAGNFSRYSVVCDNADETVEAPVTEHMWKSPPILIEAKWLPAAPVRVMNKKRFNRISGGSSSGASNKINSNRSYQQDAEPQVINNTKFQRKMNELNASRVDPETAASQYAISPPTDDDRALLELVDAHISQAMPTPSNNNNNNNGNANTNAVDLFQERQERGAVLIAQVVQYLRAATLARSFEAQDTFLDAVSPRDMRLLETVIFEYKLARACARGKSPSLGARPVPATTHTDKKARKLPPTTITHSHEGTKSGAKRRKKKGGAIPGSSLPPGDHVDVHSHEAPTLPSTTPTSSGSSSNKNHKYIKFVGQKAADVLSSPPRSPALSAIMRSSLPHEMFAKFDMLASAASSGFMPPAPVRVRANIYKDTGGFDEPFEPPRGSNNSSVHQSRQTKTGVRLEVAAAVAATAVAANERAMLLHQHELDTRKSSQAASSSSSDYLPNESVSSAPSAGRTQRAIHANRMSGSCDDVPNALSSTWVAPVGTQIPEETEQVNMDNLSLSANFCGISMDLEAAHRKQEPPSEMPSLKLSSASCDFVKPCVVSMDSHMENFTKPLA